jgi:4-coumarate--CoA ligase
LLIQHPLIKEAAVIGLPDQSSGRGDLPRAYVVPVDRSGISEEDVKNHVASNAEDKHQLRGGVVFVDELPKSAIGKLLRKDLRERAKKEVGFSARL